MMLNYWLSIDPGSLNAGIAVWQDRELVACGTVHTHDLKCAYAWMKIADESGKWVRAVCGAAPPIRIVYERPQIIEKWKKGNRNTIIDVAGGLGGILHALAGPHCVLVPVLPSEWTRQKKKHINNPRVLDRLSEAELQAVARARGWSVDLLQEIVRAGDQNTLEHALDAIAVGLYNLERW